MKPLNGKRITTIDRDASQIEAQALLRRSEAARRLAIDATHLCRRAGDSASDARVRALAAGVRAERRLGPRRSNERTLVAVAMSPCVIDDASRPAHGTELDQAA